MDGNTGQVGPEVAELLDIPHIANVLEVKERKEDSLMVACDIWGSIYLRKLELPGLITVTKDINTPRLPSLRDKMKAQKAEIEVWGLDKFKNILKAEDVGYLGSRTELIEVENIISKRKECEIIEEESEEAARIIISKLSKDMWSL